MTTGKMKKPPAATDGYENLPGFQFGDNGIEKLGDMSDGFTQLSRRDRSGLVITLGHTVLLKIFQHFTDIVQILWLVHFLSTSFD